MASVPPDAESAASAASAAPGELAALLSPAEDADALQDALRVLLEGVSHTLGVPIALLSRDGAAWKFEAESHRAGPSSAAPRFLDSPVARKEGADTELTDTAGSAWTGFVAGTSGEREWLLIVPGRAERWRQMPGLDDLMDRFARNLQTVVHLDDERQFGELHRRLYAFVRRLTRASDVAQTHACILQTLAREVHARTGALAVFSEAEQALTIVATYGYPRSIVEHIRVPAGEGIIGETFSSGRAALGRPHRSGPRRFRYHTDSYLALPLKTFGRPAAVITLTDRADGRAFDDRDFASVRLLSAPAALALARHRVSESLDELTRAATVDPVTGLFNRRYFETRIEAEVQRARRQQQDLALLMVDIDDFKRINDTFGHLEGDRALRDVADLLRRGVRIFDVCARYGGEEFAIVMPGASRQMAVQVAERIRQGVYDRSRVAPLPMTLSIGVGFLGPDQSQEDLIGSADRALIAAKRAGKNIVKTS